jgi:hypothetical protein
LTTPQFFISDLPVCENGVQYLNSSESEEHQSDQEHLGQDPELLVEVVGTDFDQPHLQRKRDAQTCRHEIKSLENVMQIEV